MGQMVVDHSRFVFYCADCQYCQASSVKMLPSDELCLEYALTRFECEASDTCPFASRLQEDEAYAKYLAKYDRAAEDWSDWVDAVDMTTETSPYDKYEDLVSDASERWPSKSNCLYRV